MLTCNFCGIEKKTIRSISGHKVKCSKNPNRKPSLGNTGKVAWNRGKTKESDATMRKISEKMSGRPARKISEEERIRISNSMILAHKEQRAWNIGMNRWKKEPSYPEKFLMRCISNEFDDKKFQREVYFNGFVMDFLWPHKKTVIEVDGKQHDLPAQRERDVRKDTMLNENGYKVLRIKWGDMSVDPKTWIDRANKFVGNGV